MSKKAVDVDGKRLVLSNLEKDLYPSVGFTKAHVLEYYSRISRFILPHLKDRALTLKRFPEGVENEFFFEKRCPSYRPSWVKTAEIFFGEKERMTVCMVNDLDTLLWVANLASLELHVPLPRVESPKTPDSMVFDLDPGDEADIVDCAHVALTLRDLLSDLKLTCYAKTSGKKGLHVYVPLNSREASFEDTKKFSKAVAEVMQRNYRDLVTTKISKEQRRGRVFINWAQNDSSKTMICVYSLRARTEPIVSFPLMWSEVESLESEGDPKRFEITHSDALRRVEKARDLFGDMIIKEQKLPYV